MVKIILFAVALAVAIGVEESAVAGPYYYVDTTNGPTRDGATPVFTDGSANTPSGTFAPWDPAAYIIAEGSARAEGGSLGARAVADLYFPGSIPFPISRTTIVGSSARFTIDDFVLSGPGSAVSGSLQLRLSGGVSANAVLLGLTSSFGRASSTVVVSGSGIGNDFFGRRDVSMDTINGLQPVVESGVLVGGGELISIPFVNAPVGTPLTLNLSLQVGAVGHVGSNTDLTKVAALGYSAFYDTLSFDTSGPAFVLPEGYRADSPTARIENSMFIPEPPSVVLLIAGLLVLALKQTVGNWFPRTRTL